MSSDNTTLQLSAQRALLGHVPSCLRSASIQKDDETILWRCIFDTTATDNDFELLQMAASEIIADFPAPIIINEEIIIAPFPDELQELKHQVYLRHEHNYYQDEKIITN